MVLVGGTFIEREQSHGYWEAAFTTAYPDRQITFRNLGWSGDTVWGESRGLFEPHLGYQQLVEQVQATEPTVLILGYGQNEAGRGPAGVEEFSRQYEKLLQDVAADGVRCVLLSPLEYAVHGSRSASASELDDHNQTIELYARAIRELAARRGDVYVDFRPDQSTGALARCGTSVRSFQREATGGRPPGGCGTWRAHRSNKWRHSSPRPTTRKHSRHCGRPS